MKFPPLISIPLLLLPALVPARDLPLPEKLGYQEGRPLDVERTVAPGVTHRLISRVPGPYVIHVSTVDLTQPGIAFEAEKGDDDINGQEKLTTMVERLRTREYRPVVSINGDFWGSRGVPINAFVDEGMIWKLPNGDGSNRSVFAFNKQGQFWIGVPQLGVSLIDAKGVTVLSIPRVNMVDEDTTFTAFNSAFGAVPPKLPAKGRQLLLTWQEGDLVPNTRQQVTVAEVKGPVAFPLPPHTWLLWSKEPFPKPLRKAKKLTLSATMSGLDGPVDGIIGGGSRLIVDGGKEVIRYAQEEGVGERFVTDKHPRTALGLKDGGRTLVLVVVDGRQPAKSQGMSLIEMADLMAELGCEQALNLDGGGSSTMTIGSEVANFPSDAGGARSVSNALIVSRTSPLAPPASLKPYPASAILAPGTEMAIDYSVILKDGEEYPLLTHLAPQVMRGADGPSLSGDGRTLRARTPWKGTLGLIAVAADGTPITGSLAAEVVEPAVVEPQPAALLLHRGDVTPLAFSMVTADGRPFSPGIRLSAIQVPKHVGWDAETRTVRALSEGVGFIEASLGTRTVSIPVAVDRFREDVILSCDVPPAEGVEYTLLRVKSSAETPTVDTTIMQSGTGSWRIDYQMQKGGTTKIGLPIKAPIPGDPLSIGIWIYGDGNEHWFRGILSDADGDRYYLDFTSSKAGIDWKDEWRFKTASLLSPTPIKAGKPRPRAPMVVEELYLVQPQEAAKKDGVILIDHMTALSLPPELIR